jgi:hypothetical protein
MIKDYRLEQRRAIDRNDVIEAARYEGETIALGWVVDDLLRIIIKVKDDEGR